MYQSDAIKSVFFPSDLSKASRPALQHGMHLARLLNCRLMIFHAGTEEPGESRKILIKHLSKLGLIKDDVQQAATDLEHLNVELIQAPSGASDPVQTILDHLKQFPHSFLVLPTAGREGLQRWLHPSLAEQIAEESRLPAVFVPSKISVKKAPDTVVYRNVLIPFDHKPDPQIAIRFACWLAEISKETNRIILFHAGNILEIPPIELPPASGFMWHKIHDPGDPVDTILATAQEYHADLIVMATAGKQGFMDALQGSVTEQVIRQSPCPVIAVPDYQNSTE